MIKACWLQRREWQRRVSSVFIKRKWTPTPLDKVDAHIYCFTVKGFTICLDKPGGSYKNHKTRRIRVRFVERQKYQIRIKRVTFHGDPLFLCSILTVKACNSKVFQPLITYNFLEKRVFVKSFFPIHSKPGMPHKASGKL